MSASDLSDEEALAVLVRRHDPDRYLCTLFASAGHRGTLFTLYAFNHELARANEVTRQAGLALIRLQWWREVVEGAAKPHAVATPLRRAIDEGRLQPAGLLAMIEAREQESEGGFETMEAWTAWLGLGAGSLAEAAAKAQGAPHAVSARMRRLGAGIGAAGQLRNIDALAAQGRCLLPATLLGGLGLSGEALVAAPLAPPVAQARRAVAEAARALLGQAEACPRPLIAAGLPAVLARRDLSGPPSSERGLGDRAAVLRAYLAGRC